MPSGRTERPVDRLRQAPAVSALHPASSLLTPPSMSTCGGRQAPLRALSTFVREPSTPAATTLFRRLTWEGTVPVEIRVDTKELTANSARGLECYFLQTPRVSYLPLLVPEIKRSLTDVVFDDEGARALREEDWWLEAEDRALLKW
jgi:hypothetical protein